ncbi:hypothetical protein B296_00039118, partial [Ensete ventricosum]
KEGRRRLDLSPRAGRRSVSSHGRKRGHDPWAVTARRRPTGGDDRWARTARG